MLTLSELYAYIIRGGRVTICPSPRKRGGRAIRVPFFAEYSWRS